MKEYTYTNKAYLGIKEGIVPPAPQYLWLNSKDDRLYKFGDNGWEVTNNAPYIVEEFTIEDILTQSTEYMPQLTISRAFLDAAHKGTPIMIKSSNESIGAIPIIVDIINNPNVGTAIRFKVQFENIKYEVSCFSNGVLIGNKDMEVEIHSYNLVDWNTNEDTDPGYIANRTHHLGYKTATSVGQRVSVAGTKGTHYIGNYKLLYDGKFYDLPKTSGSTVNIANYFRVIFNGYSESGKISTYTFTTSQLSQTLPSRTFVICRDTEEDGHKTLDEFYLPDGAKPWKTIAATKHPKEGVYVFKYINDADIANMDNVLRDKVIYQVGSGPISITTNSDISILEFKIMATASNNISINGKCVWENGVLPDTSNAENVIYSFLIVGGKVYASAKVYRTVK